MSKPKYSTYELRFAAQGEGGAEIIKFLQARLPKSYPIIAAANAKRRAVMELFGEAVECKIISVRRIPAKTIRRTLRIP